MHQQFIQCVFILRMNSLYKCYSFVMHKNFFVQVSINSQDSISVAFILISDKFSQETKTWAYYNLALEFSYIIILNIMEGSSQMHRMGSISCFRQRFPEVISHVATLQEHCCCPRASPSLPASRSIPGCQSGGISAAQLLLSHAVCAGILIQRPSVLIFLTIKLSSSTRNQLLTTKVEAVEPSCCF